MTDDCVDFYLLESRLPFSPKFISFTNFSISTKLIFSNRMYHRDMHTQTHMHCSLVNKIQTTIDLMINHELFSCHLHCLAIINMLVDWIIKRPTLRSPMMRKSNFNGNFWKCLNMKREKRINTTNIRKIRFRFSFWIKYPFGLSCVLCYLTGQSLTKNHDVDLIVSVHFSSDNSFDSNHGLQIKALIHTRKST